MDYLDKSNFGNLKINKNIKKVLITFYEGFNNIKKTFNDYLSNNETMQNVLKVANKFLKITSYCLKKYLNFHDKNIEKIRDKTFETISNSLDFIGKEEEQFKNNFKDYKTINKIDEKFNKKMSMIFKHHLNDLKDNINLDEEQDLSWIKLKTSKI